MSTNPPNQEHAPGADFSARLQELIKEFRSRYALSKASGIPMSTLQAYEAGSKPGLDALLSLARTANVTLDWLMTGKGKKRPSGILPGFLLSDVVMVDQYQPGTTLITPSIVGRMPFSRHLLESKFLLEEPTHDSLLAIEARHHLRGIKRGDLVLVDRRQTSLLEDGVYLLDLPGLVLKEISVFPGEWVLVSASENDSGDDESAKSVRKSLKMRRAELLGDKRNTGNKVVGRAVLALRMI